MLEMAEIHLILAWSASLHTPILNKRLHCPQALLSGANTTRQGRFLPPSTQAPGFLSLTCTAQSTALCPLSVAMCGIQEQRNHEVKDNYSVDDRARSRPVRVDDYLGKSRLQHRHWLRSKAITDTVSKCAVPASRHGVEGLGTVLPAFTQNPDRSCSGQRRRRLVAEPLRCNRYGDQVDGLKIR